MSESKKDKFKHRLDEAKNVYKQKPPVKLNGKITT
jgi:hypothetical protein